MQRAGNSGDADVHIKLRTRGVGEYHADTLIENDVMVELKRAEWIADGHISQCLDDLRTRGKSLFLLVNFQKPRVKWRPLIFTD